MCAIILTTLPSCKHELPTVEYCPDATNSLEAQRQKVELGVRTPPLPTCTNSLGWMIFKRLEAPVTCEGCKMWLTMNGKQTYGGMANSQTNVEIKKEDDTELPDRSGDSDSKSKKLSEEELRRLYGSLSRILGTTGR